jgi:hypothetical protein
VGTMPLFGVQLFFMRALFVLHACVGESKRS